MKQAKLYISIASSNSSCEMLAGNDAEERSACEVAVLNGSDFASRSASSGGSGRCGEMSHFLSKVSPASSSVYHSQTI